MKFYSERDLKAYFRLLEKIEQQAETLGGSAVVSDISVARVFRGATLNDWLRFLEEKRWIKIAETPVLPWQLGHVPGQSNGRYVVELKKGFYKHLEELRAGKLQSSLDALAAQMPRKAKKTAPKPPKEPATLRVTFSPSPPALLYDGLECPVEGPLAIYTCTLVFKNRNHAILETDILEAAGWDSTAPRAVYDAYIRINRKAKGLLGIEKLLGFKAGKVWLMKDHQ